MVNNHIYGLEGPWGCMSVSVVSERVSRVYVHALKMETPNNGQTLHGVPNVDSSLVHF